MRTLTVTQATEATVGGSNADCDIMVSTDGDAELDGGGALALAVVPRRMNRNAYPQD